MSINWRQFLRTAGQTASVLTAACTFAPVRLSAEPAATLIGVGRIGVGTRGRDLLPAVAHAPNVKVTAISGVYGPQRQKGRERCLNPQARAYVDYCACGLMNAPGLPLTISLVMARAAGVHEPEVAAATEEIRTSTDRPELKRGR